MSQALKIPERTTIWTFENRIGEASDKALFESVLAPLLREGFMCAAVRSSTPHGYRHRSQTTAGTSTT